MRQKISRDDVTLAILAGGKGSRMGGRIKGLMDFHGQPLIERIMGRLKPVFSRVLLVVQNTEFFSHLSMDCVSDKYEGPAGSNAGLPGAILTALETSSTKWCFVVGSDMPFVSAKLASYLLERCASYDVVVPMHRGYAEPLFALYRKDGCEPALQSMVKKGKRRVAKLYENVRVRVIDPFECKLFKDFEKSISFTNLNTLKDYEKALLHKG